MRASKKQKGRFPLRQLILLLLLVPGIYVCVQLVRIFRPTYEYETAILYTMADSIEAEGLVLFDETPVAGTGELGYLVADGERVSAGTPVAEIYTDASQAGIRTRLQSIESQISLLQKSQNTSASQVETLLSQRSTALYDLLDGLDRMDLGSTAQNKENYLTAQNKMQITTGVVHDFNARIAELQAEQETLAAQLGSPEQISAPVGGYFINSQNAALLTVSEQEVLEMPAAEFSALLEQGAQQQADGLAGKIVASYQWYFCGVCTPQQAERFSGVSKVSICFPGRAETVLPAEVVSVQTDPDAGIAKFTLKCEYIGADVLRLGQETAQIIFKSYTGIRISTAAVHMIKEDPAASSASQSAESGAASSGQNESDEVVINGEHYVRGVYVKYGNIAKFRRIERLYENDEYILVEVNGKVGTANEVRMYDEIIVNGPDLYDGKLL